MIDISIAATTGALGAEVVRAAGVAAFANKTVAQTYQRAKSESELAA